MSASTTGANFNSLQDFQIGSLIANVNTKWDQIEKSTRRVNGRRYFAVHWVRVGPRYELSRKILARHQLNHCRTVFLSLSAAWFLLSSSRWRNENWRWLHSLKATHRASRQKKAVHENSGNYGLHDLSKEKQKLFGVERLITFTATIKIVNYTFLMEILFSEDLIKRVARSSSGRDALWR